MPSVEDIRRWLRGEEVEGLPTPGFARAVAPHEPKRHIMNGKPGVDVAKMKDESLKRKFSGKYRISGDGRDALLLFGRYADRNVSEIASTSEGIGYLKWMLGQEFPSDLMDIIKYVLGV